MGLSVITDGNLDTVFNVQTPEGIELQLKIAGFWPRSLAWLLDFLIRAIIYVVLAMILAQFEKLGMGLFLILIFVLEWFYPVLFEVNNQGMTPGKSMLGIQVVNVDATPVSWTPSLIRNILRTVDFLPLLYGLGFLTMLLNQRFQRLGDLAAGTLVVYKPVKKKEASFVSDSTTELTIDLSLKEQQAIISYAERSSALSNERKDELAEILSPLKNNRGTMTPDELMGLANRFLGKS